LAEVFEAAGFPFVAPAQHKEGEVRPAGEHLGNVGDHGGGFAVNSAANLGDGEAKVDVFAGAEQVFVQWPDRIEDGAAHEHTVKFGKFALATVELVLHVGDGAIDEVVLFMDAALFFVPFDLQHDAGFATGQVDVFAKGFADAGQGTNDGGLGVIGTADQVGEPAGGDFHIVVNEDDVVGVSLGEAEVAGLVRGQVAFCANQLKAPVCQTFVSDNCELSGANRHPHKSA
jgi:hypothetical protein